jgi:large subunit ribosomal protein L13
MMTYSARKEEVQRDWFLVDAEGQVLGRLATEIASRLKGKHKPTYTPHVDTGDFIIVVNAGKVVLTGNKLKDKIYYHHTGYPGGIKSVSAGKLLQEKPEEVLRKAVRGMLPKNTLGRAMLKKLKIYAGGEHIHAAQCPKLISFDS